MKVLIVDRVCGDRVWCKVDGVRMVTGAQTIYRLVSERGYSLLFGR